MAKVKIENNHLIYRKTLREIQVSITDLVWGYLQFEDVKASMCCGGFSAVIGRAIFQDKSGKKHIFQYEGEDPARKLLRQVKEANPGMDVGYTPENIEKYAS